MTEPNPIEQSFELAAQHCCDLTPDVYRRLFRDRPETAAMFRNDGGDLVRGSMLALAIEAILDFAGERSGHFRLIACEVSSHEAYGTPQELFIDFFRVIRDTLRELLAAEWSSDMNDAWARLLVDLAAYSSDAA
jgi:hemoglobin-like flavoprotein